MAAAEVAPDGPLRLRFDVRGITSKNPTYRIPDYSAAGVYIPPRQHAERGPDDRGPDLLHRQEG